MQLCFTPLILQIILSQTNAPTEQTHTEKAATCCSPISIGTFDIKDNGIDMVYSLIGFAVGSIIPTAILYHSYGSDSGTGALLPLFPIIFYFYGFPVLYSGAYMAISLYIISSTQHEKRIKGILVGAVPGLILLGVGGGLTLAMQNSLAKGTNMDVSYLGPLVSMIAIPVLLLGMPLCDSWFE